MDLIHALIGVLSALAETPAAWPILLVFVYGLYACVRCAWDVFRAFTTFD